MNVQQSGRPRRVLPPADIARWQALAFGG